MNLNNKSKDLGIKIICFEIQILMGSHEAQEMYQIGSQWLISNLSKPTATQNGSPGISNNNWGAKWFTVAHWG